MNKPSTTLFTFNRLHSGFKAFEEVFNSRGKKLVSLFQNDYGNTFVKIVSGKSERTVNIVNPFHEGNLYIFKTLGGNDFNSAIFYKTHKHPKVKTTPVSMVVNSAREITFNVADKNFADVSTNNKQWAKYTFYSDEFTEPLVLNYESLSRLVSLVGVCNPEYNIAEHRLQLRSFSQKINELCAYNNITIPYESSTTSLRDKLNSMFWRNGIITNYKFKALYDSEVKQLSVDVYNLDKDILIDSMVLYSKKL